MSCETCRDLLIELVCDELGAETAAAVRAHALKCERCGPELEKLAFTLKASSSLALLSPSPEVEQRIMQAAREGIAGRARGPAREASQGASYGITAWFARLGSFAMSPQVAMASVLLLVVGIGLYALPFGRDGEQSALRATEDEADEHAGAPPSPAASAAATPLAQPEPSLRAEGEARGAASRPQGKMRERAMDERELLKGAQAEKDVKALGSVAARKQSATADESAYAAAPSAARADRPKASKVEPVVQAFPGSKAGAGGASAAAKPKSPSKSLDQLTDDFGASASAGSVGSSARAAAPVPERVAKKESANQGYAQPSSNGYAAAPQAAAPARAAPREAEVASEPLAKSADKRAKADAASALEQGIAALKRGDHMQGEALLKPIASGGTGSDKATAMLWLARSLRERGDCAGALTYYRTLTQAVTTPRSVLEEAADCHARTGNAAAAERLRARAALPAKQ
jgi:hypothetical protein